MEFYKLFYLIHRRTDWDRLYEFEWRIMNPIAYAEREERMRKAMLKFGLMQSLVASMTDNVYAGNSKAAIGDFLTASRILKGEPHDD